MASEAQINANRQNALKSQGPVTDLGKSVCSKNAIKHSLTGATFLLPTDRVEEFDNLVALISKKFNPETDVEKDVIYNIAITEWRLRRIPFLEGAIQAKADFEMQHAMEDMAPADRVAYVEGSNQHIYMKDFLNLSLLESRLRRTREKLTAEFKELRREREMIQTAYRNQVMHTILVDPITRKPNADRPHRSIGSEFSIQYMVARVEFKAFAQKGEIEVFDRAWRDKSSKTPD